MMHRQAGPVRAGLLGLGMEVMLAGESNGRARMYILKHPSFSLSLLICFRVREGGKVCFSEGVNLRKAKLNVYRPILKVLCPSEVPKRA